MFVTNFELFCSAGLGPPRSLEMSVSEKGRKLKAKKLPFAPSPSKALVKGELYQLRRTGFKRVTVLIAADQHDVWCIWGESLRLPIACIREISITKLHALEFRIDTFVNGTHVFRAPQRPGALHYWVATLQTLCAQCMEPASRWRIVWAVSRVQARWRGLLGRKRAEMEQRKRASAEADKLSAAERSRIANQAAQVARDERAQVPPPHPILQRPTHPRDLRHPLAAINDRTARSVAGYSNWHALGAAAQDSRGPGYEGALQAGHRRDRVDGRGGQGRLDSGATGGRRPAERRGPGPRLDRPPARVPGGGGGGRRHQYGGERPLTLALALILTLTLTLTLTPTPTLTR